MFVRLLALALIVTAAGCGPRAEVAKERLLAQVDSLLGEVAVKRKEAEIAIGGLEAGLDRLKRAKIEVKVRLSQITERVSDLEAKIRQADAALARLRDHLTDDRDAEIGRRTYTVVAPKDLADRTISAREKLAAEADALRPSKQLLENVVASLEQRERRGRERLRSLKQHLHTIGVKMIALKSVQDAAAFGTTETLAIDGLERQVRELAVKIEVELAFHQEKWQETDSVGDFETLVNDTLAEIDRILGNRAW